MKFKEFENNLQELLDQRDLDSSDQLISHVDPEDYDQCVQLLISYQTMFSGLDALSTQASSYSEDALEADVFSEKVIAQLGTTEETSGQKVSRSNVLYILMAVAASLLLLALPWTPLFTDDDQAENQVVPQQIDNSTLVSTQEPQSPQQTLENGSSVTTEELYMMDWENIATSFTSTASPEQMAYADPEPWIEGVSTRLRPLTDSVGTAFTVIRKSTIPPTNAESSDMKPQAQRDLGGNNLQIV